MSLRNNHRRGGSDMGQEPRFGSPISNGRFGADTVVRSRSRGWPLRVESGGLISNARMAYHLGWFAPIPVGMTGILPGFLPVLIGKPVAPIFDPYSDRRNQQEQEWRDRCTEARAS